MSGIATAVATFEGQPYRLRSASARWVSFPIVIVVVYLAWFQFTVTFPTWEVFNYLSSYSFLLVGPLSVFAGYSAGAYEARDGWLDMVAATPRWPITGTIQHAMSTLVWCLGAYCAGLVYPAVVIVEAGGGGDFEFIHLASGVSAILAAVLFSYVLGFKIRHIWVAPLITVVVYAIIGFSAFGDRAVGRLTPLPLGEPSPFFPYSTVVSSVRLILYLGLATISVSLLLFASSAGAHRLVQVVQLLGAVGLIVGVSASLWLMASVDDHPQQFSYAGVPLSECVTTRSSIRVCIHTAYSSLLEEVSATVDAVAPYVAPMIDGKLVLIHDDRNVGSASFDGGVQTLSYTLEMNRRDLNPDLTAAIIVRALIMNSPCELADDGWASAAIVLASGYEPPPWIDPGLAQGLRSTAQQLERTPPASWRTCSDVEAILNA